MSAHPQAYCQYRNAMVDTAAPGRLLVMLFDAAVRNLDTAAEAIERRDPATAHARLVKTQDIVAELMSSLDMRYDIARQLLPLYEYLHHRLVQANVKKDPAAIGEVRGFLVELREAWATAARRAGTVPAARQVQAGLALEG